VAHFGGIANLFKATLTELEATGIRTVSAQSRTGRSMELAYQELGRTATQGSAWSVLMTRHTRSSLSRSTIRRSFFICGGILK